MIGPTVQAKGSDGVYSRINVSRNGTFSLDHEIAAGAEPRPYTTFAAQLVRQDQIMRECETAFRRRLMRTVAIGIMFGVIVAVLKDSPLLWVLVGIVAFREAGR
jgi:hypothetical protein